ncbi:MAG TPA: hypothetical protein V6C97_00705 [Oculatellaceae cyanobacterium]
MFTRDPVFKSQFFEMGALPPIMTQCAGYVTDYFSATEVGSDCQFVAEALIEIASILKRFAAEPAYQSALFELGAPDQLVLMLSAREPLVLHAALVVLSHLAYKCVFFFFPPAFCFFILSISPFLAAVQCSWIEFHRCPLWSPCFRSCLTGSVTHIPSQLPLLLLLPLPLMAGQERTMCRFRIVCSLQSCWIK